jgi:hypothetical protein
VLAQVFGHCQNLQVVVDVQPTYQSALQREHMVDVKGYITGVPIHLPAKIGAALIAWRFRRSTSNSALQALQVRLYGRLEPFPEFLTKSGSGFLAPHLMQTKHPRSRTVAISALLMADGIAPC